ncbi:MAG TPA: DinB family protein [Ktedonobacterales bacterium]
MTAQPFSLAQCYKGWDQYQQQLIAAIAPLSPEQLTLRAAPHLRPIAPQVAHMIATRARWLYLDLGEGGAELDALTGWDGWNAQTNWDGSPPPARSAAELVSGLETTWQVIHDALERWTIADLEEVFPPAFPGEDSFTRQFVIWHLIEHDLHHGGELALVLGMHGLAAPRI